MSTGVQKYLPSNSDMCDSGAKSRCFVEIVEQPRADAVRFRYGSEGRYAGSVLGVNSTEDEKTYPSIRVLNYDGAGVVVVSCISVDKYEQHPNCLVGKGCDKGVCKLTFTTKATAPTIITFQQLGIRIAKIVSIASSLEERERLNIDPFKKGFAHKKRPRLINLHQVRLCFQVILISDRTNPKQLTPLKPIVSDVICDVHKTNKQLLIHRLSDNFGPTCGGKQIILLCDKVDRKDIKIRFYEKGAGETIAWEDWALFQPKDVHYQTAITFKTPRYKVKDIVTPVEVLVQLQVISGAAVSNTMAFQYVPESTKFELALSTKKRKIEKSAAFLLNLSTAYNIDRADMDRNIDPNEVGAENIAPSNTNVMQSNFFVPNNNPLRTQPQCYDHFYANDQQFQQQPDYQQFQTHQTSDCQWPQQPLHNILPESPHRHKQFEKPLLEQYNHLQYHPMVKQSEHNIEPIHGNLSSQFSQLNYRTEVTDTYGAEGNFRSNDFSNFGLRANYQSPNGDACTVSHQTCQQIGPVHAYDPVVIQQFVNNNGQSYTNRQQEQQKGAAIQNAEKCSPDFSLL